MKIKGSILIEASILFPILFLTIMILLLLAHYQHDRLVLRSEMRVSLMRSLVEETEEGREEGGEETFPLFYMSYSTPKTERKGKKGKIGAEVKFSVYPRFLSLDGSLMKGRAEETYRAYRPQEKVRRQAILFGE